MGDNVHKYPKCTNVAWDTLTSWVVYGVWYDVVYIYRARVYPSDINACIAMTPASSTCHLYKADRTCGGGGVGRSWMLVLEESGRVSGAYKVVLIVFQGILYGKYENSALLESYCVISIRSEFKKFAVVIK